MLKIKSLLIFLIGLVFLVFMIKDAYAYLDPGSGSYIFQLLMAGLLGMLFVMKTFWGRIISFFKRLFVKKGRGNG